MRTVLDELDADALAALDRISAPLGRREIHRLLRPYLTRRQRDALIVALKGIAIVAIFAGPNAHERA